MNRFVFLSFLGLFLLVAYNCSLQAVCPIITAPLNSTQSICSGGAVNLNALQNNIGIDNPANPSFGGFAWFSDIALTQTLTDTTFTFSGFNTCETQVITIYVAAICSEQVQPIAAGELNIIIYPEPPSPLQSSNCLLTVNNILCSSNIVIEYLQPDNTWASTPAISQPTNGATAVWRAYIMGAPDLDNDGFPDCMRSGTSVASDCPCIPPLVPTAVGNDTLLFCENIPNTTAFTATSSIGTTINWYNQSNDWVATGNNYAPILAGNYYAIATLDDGSCSSSASNMFVLQSQTAADASFTYPLSAVCVGDAPFLPNFVNTAGGTFSALGGLNIDALTGSITPNVAGSYIVSYYLSGNCPDTELEVVNISACCPTVTTPLLASYTMCDGATAPNFADYENSVTYNDPDGNFTQFAWFGDIGLNNPLTPADYAHSGNNTCLPETHTVYLGILCANQSQAIAAGSLNIQVIPTPDLAVFSALGGCSLQISENCIGSPTIQYQQSDGSWSGIVPDLSPSEGQTANWRAFLSNTPDNDADGVVDCFVSGTVTASSCNCTAPPAPVALIDTITACSNTTNLQALMVQAPANSFIIWRDANNNQIATGNTYVPSVGGVYYAQAASLSDTCLGGQIATYFIQSPLSDASFSYSNSEFCANGTIITPTISGDLGGVFSASGGLYINPNTGAITLNQAGIYTISYQVGLACPNQQSLVLQLNSNVMQLSAGIDAAVCAGDTLTLNGVANGALWSAWSGSGTFIQSDNDTTAYIPSVADTLQLVLSAQSACGVLQQDTVTVIAQTATTFSVMPSDTTIVAGAGILLQTEGASNIIWEDDPSLTCTHCSQTVAFPTQNTTYAVYSLEQCVLPQIVTVTVIQPQPVIPPDTLVVPNAFSPNHDGNNDEFIPLISGDIVSYHLQIFNRWGNLLFDTDIPQYGWDGTDKGRLCNIGTYSYLIDYELMGQQPNRLKGYMTLLR
jgi:gliding motility-associated-like protein